jgi:hypothetical protein
VRFQCTPQQTIPYTVEELDSDPVVRKSQWARREDANRGYCAADGHEPATEWHMILYVKEGVT